MIIPWFRIVVLYFLSLFCFFIRPNLCIRKSMVAEKVVAPQQDFLSKAWHRDTDVTHLAPKVLAPQCFFSDFWNGNTISCQTSRTGFKSVTLSDWWQLARLVALWYNLVIEIRRIIRLISGHLDKEKFAENFGEFFFAFGSGEISRIIRLISMTRLYHSAS